MARETLVDLAPRLRRRATLLVRSVPTALREALERDAALVRSGLSAASACGWDELLRPGADPAWVLDAYLPIEAFSALQEELNRLDIDGTTDDAPGREAVLLRVVEEPWPFPPHYQLAAQPLAALDLLDYPHSTARRMGRGVLESLKETPAPLLARRSARGRAKSGPLLGRLLGGMHQRRAPRPVVEGDPRTDTRAAAAHVVGIELIRGSASDSALDTLLDRKLIERNPHQLLVTTRAFLDYAGLRDLADVPPLEESGDVQT